MTRETIRYEVEGKIAWLWGAAFAILGVSIIMVVWFPLLHIRSAVSFNYNEGWNAYRQLMTAERQPLYGKPPALWMTNYPFLSFHIVGSLGALIGNMVLAGRIIAFFSMILIAAFAGGIVQLVSGSAQGGVYAGLCLFLWMATFTPELMAVNDPELLGAAVAGFGLLAYVKGPEGLLWVGLSALAFAASLFIKQDFIALPLSVALHLAVNRRWRALAVWLPAGFVAAILLTGLTFRLDGPWFFANLLQPRAYVLRNLGYNIAQYSVHFAAPLAVCGAFLIRDRGIPCRGLLFLLLLITHAVSIFFSGGDGVAQNIFSPPMIALAVAGAIALCSLSRSRNLALFAAVLAVPVLAGAAFVPFQVQKDLAAQRNLPAVAQAAQRAVTLLRSVNGPAICEDILLCLDAGKPLGFDPYFVKDQLLIGRLKEPDVLALLLSHRYAAIEIDGSVKAASRRRRFTRAFMQTLLTQYRPVLDSGIYSVFEPRAAISEQ